MDACEGKTPETGSWLIVAKAVRQHLKNHEISMHCGSDALPVLNAKLADLLREATARAHANGRKTLKGCDF
jgi:histone H3/H4